MGYIVCISRSPLYFLFFSIYACWKLRYPDETFWSKCDQVFKRKIYQEVLVRLLQIFGKSRDTSWFLVYPSIFEKYAHYPIVIFVHFFYNMAHVILFEVMVCFRIQHKSKSHIYVYVQLVKVCRFGSCSQQIFYIIGIP